MNGAWNELSTPFSDILLDTLPVPQAAPSSLPTCTANVPSIVNTFVSRSHNHQVHTGLWP
eukprot:m.26487 g.26487  ORF g.26487 m.26487 type:complete len:60 (+) comp6317_c0_seq1:1377-1556(+)